MLKLLSASVATAVLALWPSQLYSFDKGRFFTNVAVSFETGVSEFYPENPAHTDQLEPAPSGRTDKIQDEAKMNTVSAKSVKPMHLRSGGSNSRFVADSGDDMNILYSDASSAPGANGECEPSLMTATDDEVLVVRTAQSYGVDPALAKAIVWAESRFDQTRNSDQGALASTQIVPGTGPGPDIHDICDPAAKIDGRVRHLKLMLDEFRNPILAVAAYNAGAQAVYANGGVPPFPETVRFVAAVLNHQMGLQMPLTSSAGAVTAPGGSALPDDMASDVLGARGNRFVNGVMQF